MSTLLDIVYMPPVSDVVFHAIVVTSQAQTHFSMVVGHPGCVRIVASSAEGAVVGHNEIGTEIGIRRDILAAFPRLQELVGGGLDLDLLPQWHWRVKLPSPLRCIQADGGTVIREGFLFLDPNHPQYLAFGNPTPGQDASRILLWIDRNPSDAVIPDVLQPLL